LDIRISTEEIHQITRDYQDHKKRIVINDLANAIEKEKSHTTEQSSITRQSKYDNKDKDKKLTHAHTIHDDKEIT